MADEQCTCHLYRGPNGHLWSCEHANPLADMYEFAHRETPAPQYFYLPQGLIDACEAQGIRLPDNVKPITPIDETTPILTFEEDSDADPLVPDWVMDSIRKHERERIAAGDSFRRALEQAAVDHKPGDTVTWSVIKGGKRGPLNP